jgi:hypothetical protein
MRKLLYEDNFLKLGKWLNSAVFTLVIGIPLAFVFGTIHWSLGIAWLFIAIISSIASYIVLKK